MELYCARCESSFDEIEEAALLAGECVTCQGQLTVGISSLNNSAVAGVVAMSFDTGSAIGIPLTPQFDSFGVDTTADFSETAAVRTAAIASATEADAETEDADANEGEQPEAEGTATNPYALPVDDPPDQATPSPPSAGDGVSNANGDPAEEGRDLSDQEPAVESDASVSVNDTPADTDDSAPAASTDPSADFSMPSLPSFGSPTGSEAAQTLSENEPATEEASAPVADDSAATESAPSAAHHNGTTSESAASSDASALPAHLQLPSFPQFDMNFDPSAATGKAPADPEPEPVGVEATAPGGVEDLPPAPADLSQAQPDAAAPQAPPGVPAHLMPQQLPNGVAGAPVAAPPVAAPDPPAAAPQLAEDSLPSLPDFGLPSLGSAAAKREVTLLESDAAEELATELQKKRSVLPLILGSLIIVGGLAGAGIWKRDEIVDLIVPDTQIKRTLTKTERAEEALAQGVLAFKAATAKEVKPETTKKKLAEAVELYEAAIGLDPKLGDAHLRLAVGYAKQNKKAKAVEHYKRYVELVPKGSKTASVKKIVADWEKAQKSNNKKNGDSASTDAKKKKKKRR